MAKNPKSKLKAKKTQLRRLNKQRRERYQKDATYRQAVNERNRLQYRERAGTGVFTHEAAPPTTGLVQFGTSRRLVGDPEGSFSRTFTVREVATALGDYNGQTMYRWLRDGRLPPMETEAYEPYENSAGVEREAKVAVYLYQELQVIAQTLREHQLEFSYYRASHHETKAKILAAVNKVRGR